MNIEKFRQMPAKSRFEHLRSAFAKSPEEGSILEFGVFNGSSLCEIARMAKGRKVYGLDSFEGLPEEWVRTKKGGSYKAGHFRVRELPTVPENVELIKGFFDQTLESLKPNLENIAFLHNDSDLYSSTIYVLETLNDLIVPGTVIVFDELCDWKNSGTYETWEDHEWKALNEWVEKYDRKYKILGRGINYEASIVITK